MKKGLLLCCLFLMLAACAPQGNRPVPGMPGIQNETFVLRNLPWLKEISTHERILASGLKQVAVMGRSYSTVARKCYIKVDWFSEDGFPIETRLSRWDPVTVQPQGTLIHSVVAPSEAAVNYHVLLTDELRETGKFDPKPVHTEK